MEPLQIIWQSKPFLLNQLHDVAASLAKEIQSRLASIGSENSNPRGVVAMQAVMGAGKTTVVQALCRHWGFADDAVSPTFGLVQCYTRDDWKIYHHDLYRLTSEEEVWDLGLIEYLEEDALNFVEWPERAPGLMPDDALLLQIEVLGKHDDGERRIILSHRLETK